MENNKELVIAVPKGRILKELDPFFKKIGLIPEDDFYNKESRALKFATNHENISIIRVRSFDVPTFVTFGGADMGISGNDVLEEFDYDNLYSPIDLKIGYCRLSVAQPNDLGDDINSDGCSHVRIASKYPNLTKQYFENKGIGVDIIKLNGAMELAPMTGLSQRIVDLVSTGKTLKENGLREVDTILEISSRLIVNRTALKTRNEEIQYWIDKFEECVS
ncbi:MAG: ATP phosphoribosyltransferase [Alphaproteobacteria bacterium]